MYNVNVHVPVYLYSCKHMYSVYVLYMYTVHVHVFMECVQSQLFPAKSAVVFLAWVLMNSVADINNTRTTFSFPD